MKIKILLFVFYIFSIHSVLAQGVEDRNIEEFDRIDASGYFDIYLKKGDKPSLRVESKRLSLDEIITRVSGTTLRIETTRRHFRDEERSIIYVTYTNLKDIYASVAGNIIGESPIQGEKLRIEMSGAGNIELEVEVQNLDVRLSGVGNLEIMGKTKDLEVDMSGTGAFRGFKLKAENAEVFMSGVGKAQVYATERLIAETSGIGSIRYRGEPKKIRARANFLGSVKPD
ncbi:head GIN domain-containing protein [Thermoflexibacter ruber]|uniref:Putative auto-transporter adhesin, head GIN domain n=1 Tax=Thermoflexibacter ruber TaxID=1003 RepID=A0A1I2JSV0_9BACT|nr:head GIN domain-containing protein [Thermoflexibacter ruber]SFF57644.1 Putative auto-transporter adhesin, head GIN domain [Thermoflexibacter ruber]